MSLTSSSSAPQFCSSVWPALSELWVRAITHRVSRSGPVTQPTCPHSRVWMLRIALTGMDGIHTPFRLDAGRRSTRITSAGGGKKVQLQLSSDSDKCWFGSGLISGASRLLRHLCRFDQRSVAPALWMVQTMTGNKDLSFPGNFQPQLELISFIVVSVFSSNYFGNTA